jgi:hypothetical protein
VANRREDECVAALGAEIVALAANEDRRLALSSGAIARSRESSWAKVVAALYAEICNRMQNRGAAQDKEIARNSIPMRR